MTKRSILFSLLLPIAAVAAKPGNMDICRIDHKAERVTCQRWRDGKKVSRNQIPQKQVDRWMAVPCRQLARHIPDLSCRKSLGEVRMGESVTDKP
jgi:hypothetical protein